LRLRKPDYTHEINWITPVTFLTYVSFGQNAPGLSLDKIFKEYHFYPNDVESYRSAADGEFYTVLEPNLSIVRYDYKTGRNRTVIMPANALPDTILSIHDYEFCSDESKILLTTYVKKIYRHSFEARFLDI